MSLTRLMTNSSTDPGLKKKVSSMILAKIEGRANTETAKAIRPPRFCSTAKDYHRTEN